MLDREQDHIAAGWNDDRAFRWIEAGRLRLEEDDKGALATIQTLPGVRTGDYGDLEAKRPGAVTAVRVAVLPGPTHLSATELAGLVGHLAAWFADDPTDMIHQIETCATYVHTELEAWNARARIDEEHPPYDKLTNALDELAGKCRDLRESLGKFTEGEK